MVAEGKGFVDSYTQEDDVPGDFELYDTEDVP